jgi:polysaccharide biosynthesis protein PslH
MRILFLSRWFPFPQDNGSKIRVFNLLKYLAGRHTVDLLSFSSAPVDNDRIEEMSKVCRRVETAVFQETHLGKLQTLRNLFSPVPLFLHKTHSPEMQRLVEEAVREQTYDIVIASQMSMVPYAQLVPVRFKVFEEIELTVFYEKYWLEENPIKRWRSWLTWSKATRYIASSLNSFDAGTVVSEIERQRVEQKYAGSSPIIVIPNGVDIPDGAQTFGHPKKDTLVFSGSLTYDANFDAVHYFMKEVFPLVKGARPEVKLLVTGKIDGVPVDDLPNKEWITFTGYLEDVRPTVATSWINVVPLRKGGGTRLKILEALSLGTPVITTSKGAEGLALDHQRELLVADDADVFADTILKVLGSYELREQYGQIGRRKVSEKYDWKVIGPVFCEFIEEVVNNGGKIDRFFGLSRADII